MTLQHALNEQSTRNYHEPIHVHVQKDGSEAKYNILTKIEQEYNYGFKKHDIKITE